MGWDNPPVPWREFERRLSWRQGDKGGEPDEPADGAGRPVTRLPVAGPDPAGPGTRRRVPTGNQVPWAELHCHSAYSFLDGASTPGELIAEAAECGLTAIAITDHDGMYGVPQFAQSAARFLASEEGAGSNVATVFGAELSLDIPPVITPAIAAARQPGAGPASGWRAGMRRASEQPAEGEPAEGEKSQRRESRERASWRRGSRERASWRRESRRSDRAGGWRAFGSRILC